MATSGIAVLGAPSNLGLRPLHAGHVPGTWRAPAVLRAAGLIERLGAYDHGDLPRPRYDPANDPATGYRNGAALPGFSATLADRLGDLLDRERFVLLLGGDCSITLGTMLALRRRGRYGLLFLDGHNDYYQSSRSTGRTAAGNDLGLVLGDGPAALVDIEGRRPYLQAQDAVVFGYREDQDTADYSFASFRRATCAKWPLQAVRRCGVRQAMDAALATLERVELAGFWVHLDVDVLDPRWMPAVDSPDPGGMTPDELVMVLRRALVSPRVVGMQLTIFDPDLDADGACATRLVNLLADALGSRAGV